MHTPKVVITGASGFIGSHVLRLLSTKKNLQAVGVTRKNISDLYAVSEYSQSPFGDILIHLAEDNDRFSVANAHEGYEKSLIESIDALAKKGYRKIIYVSSSVLYGDKNLEPHRPCDPITVVDNYSNIKRRVESAVLSTSSGVVVRLANVYGPGMSEKNVVSTILRQIPGVGPIVIQDASPVRDFIWVKDVAQGIVALVLGVINANIEGRIFNLGTGLGTSIGSLAELSLRIAAENDRVVLSKNLLVRQSCLILDYSDTTSACGWKPSTTLKQGLSQLLQLKTERVKYE
jgi:UDP-glucose 4-epimerase